MSKKFYKPKLKDMLYIVIMIIATYEWINYDQVIIKSSELRMLAYVIIGLGLMLGLYFAIKPTNIRALSNTLVIILVPLFIILSLIIHLVVVKNGFSLKSIILWILTTGMIYLAGVIYKSMIKHN